MYISPTDIDANLTNATASVIGNDVYLIDESNGLFRREVVIEIEFGLEKKKTFFDRNVNTFR